MDYSSLILWDIWWVSTARTRWVLQHPYPLTAECTR